MKEFPFNKVNFCSQITFHWLNGFIWEIFKKKEIIPDKLYKCSKEELTYDTTLRMEKLWLNELKVKGIEKASFNSVIYKFCRKQFCFAIICSILSSIFSFIGPAICFLYLIDYVKSNNDDWVLGIVLIISLFLSELGRTLSLAYSIFLSYRIAIRLRSALMGLVYQKILRLRGLQGKSVGEFINFFSNDCPRYIDLCFYLPMIVAPPLLAVATIIYCIILMGPWTLFGASLLILYTIIQSLLSFGIMKIRGKTIAVTDKRVKIINEILTNIRLIKLYDWKDSFSRIVMDIRKKEKKHIQNAAFLQSISLSSIPLIPLLSAIITFVVYLYAGNVLYPGQAFVIISLYNITKVKLGTLPIAIRALSECIVSSKRAKDILLLHDVELDFTAASYENAIEIIGGDFEWDKNNIPVHANKYLNIINKYKKNNEINNNFANRKEEFQKLRDYSQDKFMLKDINLKILKGKLIGVCGKVGSGKSSLLNVMINQLQKISGSIGVNGTICYVPQQAWIINSTLKENILFGRKFDLQRYNEVLVQCCLKQDLKMLPNGNETEIGERGINLSGGQKQRISLARAIYSDRDIYLLDDPLSAVDTHVGELLFNDCLKKCVQNGKTVICVTHQLQYLPHCDEVILMSDGRIEMFGTHTQLMNECQTYSQLQLSYQMQSKKDENKNDDEGVQPDIDMMEKINLITEKKFLSTLSLSGNAKSNKESQDETQEGLASILAYDAYIKSAGGYVIAIFVISLFILVTVVICFNNWWLSIWLNIPIDMKNSTILPGRYSNNTYIAVYGFSGLFLFVVLLFREIAIVKSSLRASSYLHNLLFVKILRRPMYFFDVTPVGRLLNRFSSDMDEVDSKLPFQVKELLQDLCAVLAALIMVSIIIPMFLIPCLLLSLFFFLLYIIGKHVLRLIKSYESASRSPLFSHIGTSIQGLGTIRAFEKQQDFIQKFNELVDNNSVSLIYLFYSIRWLALRLDLLAIFATSTTGALIIILKDSISPSYAGLALSYVATLNGLFQYTVRLMSEVEARFVSVQRINHFIENSVEEAPETILSSQLPLSWPNEGAIVFEKFNMNYRPDLPLVLKDINCSILPMEKIGIVGRTGSGKSSLALSLFRLTEAHSGRILIDGIDISQIGLHDLRSKISIIPQDPVLFCGTIRYNIDPFNEHSDEILWQTLENCHMKEKVESLHLKLMAEVVEDGENFSVGERQLFCMARALLKRSKILVMDEATAAVDVATDKLIQSTIEKSFSNCTVLSIAHRLKTIMHSDRIIVINIGTIIEFDTPNNLMQRPDSVFAAMIAKDLSQR